MDGCIAVQADQSENETHFLLDLAEKHDFIKGVVGWVDLRSPDLDGRLEYFSQYPKLKGFRHIIQAEPEGFMMNSRFLDGVRKLGNYHFSYDILIFEHQLKECIEFVKILPEVNFVIDHLAKPSVKQGEFDAWAANMKKMAEFPNVNVKLSGMVTEADWDHWRKTDFKPYLETCLGYFGAERLMIGSDWPVCLLAAEYEDGFGIVEEFVSQLSPSEYDAIMGKTATSFYRLI